MQIGKILKLIYICVYIYIFTYVYIYIQQFFKMFIFLNWGLIVNFENMPNIYSSFLSAK